ncbi:LacI family DNA-binding transcriptional regulator [Bacillus kexueae]|uniref:LacI family DNA-binding transcriptional regulator n=1 Tax=Aeribacillus kexueae TaxID=2078952 RepID=UPI001FB045A0|nr:LacI family DNA-binding transcriptional regulator [Bacillus kexueae]
MKVTIKDIAKLAGVSPGTVSKIINNYQDVGEETKRKVLKIMEETGYTAVRAQKEASYRSNVIGVIYAGKINADFNHPFFIEVMNAFRKSIGILGYDLLFFSSEQEKGKEDYYQRAMHHKVDGVFIISGEEVQPSIYELDKSSIPCIGVDIQLEGNQSAYIMTDNYKISSKVVEHFYLNGYREIGFIGGLPGSKIGQMREEGFRNTMAEFGLSVTEEWITNGDFFTDSGYLAMKQMLRSPKGRPQAVFATSDLMAFGAMKAIKEHGLKIPEDIALVGCDDVEACNYTDPPLSSVHQDKKKIGRLAAYMLHDMINNQIQPSAVMVEPELIVRESCGSHESKMN